jgi:hypothetical protein
VTSEFGVGRNEFTNKNYIWGFQSTDLKIYTNNSERLRIKSECISNDLLLGSFKCCYGAEKITSIFFVILNLFLLNLLNLI